MVVNTTMHTAAVNSGIESSDELIGSHNTTLRVIPQLG